MQKPYWEWLTALDDQGLMVKEVDLAGGRNGKDDSREGLDRGVSCVGREEDGILPLCYYEKDSGSRCKRWEVQGDKGVGGWEERGVREQEGEFEVEVRHVGGMSEERLKDVPITFGALDASERVDAKVVGKLRMSKRGRGRALK